jgi:hypothetical protein
MRWHSVERPGEYLDKVTLQHPTTQRAVPCGHLLVQSTGQEHVRFRGLLKSLQQGRSRARLHEPVPMHEHLTDGECGKRTSSGLPPGNRVGRHPKVFRERFLRVPQLLTDDTEHVPGNDPATDSCSRSLTAGQGRPGC